MLDGNKPTVGIVGFGYIGCTIGAVLASKGFNVKGVDTSTHTIDTVNSGKSPFNEPGLADLISSGVSKGLLSVSADASVVKEADVVVVAVGTPLSEDGDADLSQIRTACETIQPFMREGQLVVFKSTLPPGTTADVATPILRKNANVQVAFSPERLAEGRAIQELLSIPIVVGGVDEQSGEVARKFWSEALDVEVLMIGSSQAAELVKLADNLWIDLNISLANELAKLSDALEYDIDVLEVISAANTLPKGQHNVNILIPSMGVGGYCLTKDPWFVAGVGKRHGLDLLTPVTSRRVNDSMPDYTVERISTFFKEGGKEISDIKIAVLGLAFKNNTGDTRFTPVVPVLGSLREKGIKDMPIYDPWVSARDASAVGEELENNLEDVLADADCVAFFAGHDDFKDITPAVLQKHMKPGGLVLDGRIFFNRETIEDINSRGLHYRGIGR